jgi:hypothetical protein
MTIMSSGVRSQAWRRAGAGSPSIREVCLVGIRRGCSAPSPGVAAVLGGMVAPRARVTWSGRPYSVAATQVLTARGSERCCYVHLSVLTEDGRAIPRGE